MSPPAGQASLAPSSSTQAEGHPRAVGVPRQEQLPPEPLQPRTPDEHRDVEHQLKGLKLEDVTQVSRRSKPVAVETAAHVKAAFGELLATSPTQLIMQPDADDGGVREAKMWDAFAEVYMHELRALEDGADDEVTKERKRQVLADILVWAEVTQSHYDSSTASFVTEPHGGDESFQRIGRFLKAAKLDRGLH